MRWRNRHPVLCIIQDIHEFNNTSGHGVETRILLHDLTVHLAQL